MKMVEKLDLALKEKGWTQTAFERAAMLSENRISKWKNGAGEPTAKQALRMARLLGLPYDFLIDDDQDKPGLLPLSDREKQIWDVVRTIGVDEAWRRLLQPLVGAVPEPARPSVVLTPVTIRPGDEAKPPEKKRKGAG
jgi:transcriptional regulator with XRE-family HTH domain